MRKEFEKKKKEHFPNHNHMRYIFIPVDWRSSLILDDGIIESITPKSIQTIRDKLNSSALDIMYYTSPLFRSEVNILLKFIVNIYEYTVYTYDPIGNTLTRGRKYSDGIVTSINTIIVIPSTPYFITGDDTNSIRSNFY